MRPKRLYPLASGSKNIEKTSLGIHVAADLLPHFRDGVYFVALAPIADPEMVTATIAKVFGLADSGRRPLGEVLTQFLRDREMLLLLDNFEQVIEAAPA